MAVTHGTPTRNAAADAVVDRVDGGAGAGELRLLTAGAAEVATLTFSDPAFGNAASGVAAAAAITSDSSATGGTVALFAVVDSDANVIFQGTVTGVGGGGDIELSSVVIGAGETVSASAFSYTAMP